jgi:hypothetical protein
MGDNYPVEGVSSEYGGKVAATPTGASEVVAVQEVEAVILRSLRERLASYRTSDTRLSDHQ